MISARCRQSTLFNLATSKTQPTDPADQRRKTQIAATFLPIVRQEKMTSFLADWGKWFVLEDTHEDAKIPGKLKSMYYYLLKVL